MDRVFVTGATGVFGRRVVKLLLDKGVEVVALCRSHENEEQIEALGVIPAKANLFEVGYLRKAMKGCSTIFHLATSIPRKEIPKLKDWKENDKIRTEGTANLIEAASQCGVSRFIVPSITFLYGDHQGTAVNKDAALHAANNKFFKSAYEMEQAVVNAPGIDSIILRYGTFYSADSFQTQIMIDAVKRQKLPIIGDGRHFKNYIHADDAAEAMVHAYSNFEIHRNKVLNITDFKPLQYVDVLKFIARKTQSKPPKRITDWMARFFVEKDLLTYLEASYRIEGEPNIIGWQPQHNFVEFMSGYLSAKQALNEPVLQNVAS